MGIHPPIPFMIKMPPASGALLQRVSALRGKPRGHDGEADPGGLRDREKTKRFVLLSCAKTLLKQNARRP
ncbi:hypothetical protein [Chromobacterium vaccinii]|uniref:hypothetical protein n=1 Tax=Chromobacterium vaccinii TaxID=1108595 RepID=UPI001319C6C5|nr:hypothetical protein [Chromobacterium vaccinii]